jgi:hypothetical protein
LELEGERDSWAMSNDPKNNTKKNLAGMGSNNDYGSENVENQNLPNWGDCDFPIKEEGGEKVKIAAIKEKASNDGKSTLFSFNKGNGQKEVGAATSLGFSPYGVGHANPLKIGRTQKPKEQAHEIPSTVRATSGQEQVSLILGTGDGAGTPMWKHRARVG